MGHPWWTTDPRYFVMHVELPGKDGGEDGGLFYIAYLGDIPENARRGVYQLPIDAFYSESYDGMCYAPYKGDFKTAKEYADHLQTLDLKEVVEAVSSKGKSMSAIIRGADFPGKITLLNEGYLKFRNP